MKKNYPFTVCALLLAGFHNADLQAQCATSVSLGASSNMFTIIRNGNNPVAADKMLNMVTFIHRNNAAAFGGNSGHLRYDISTNAGSSWTVNQGVLNPNQANLARYPNMAIYNPNLNTNPSNAYVSFMAATINSATSAWNGLVSGVQKTDLTGLTESYNQPVVSPQLIPHSLVKGAPGVFWAIDPLYNGFYSGYAIYKGTWNTSTNDINWVTNYTVAPTWSAFSGQDYNIAFDPTGQFGWFCVNGHVSGGPTTAAYYPTLWRTVNGGTSWTGPYTADLSKMGCFSSFVNSPNVPSANLEHDLVVDMYGNPHIFTTIMNSVSYGLNYNMTHWMYDITLQNDIWAAYPVGIAHGGMAQWGSGADIAQMWQAPQAARTADGSKVFFTWADNSNYSTGIANTTPNLFTRAFDVQQKQWTLAKDVTSCNSQIAGKIIFPHLAPEVLEPSSNVYKLAPVYAEFTSAGDPLQVTNFHFLDNVTFAAAEFSLALPNHSVSIVQGPSLLLCPGSTVAVSVNGGQAIWNTGATTTIISVSSGTTNMYIVTAQKDCIVGMDTITVTDLSVTATALGSGACPGGTVAVTATGNANSYTWTPGPVTGATANLVAGNQPWFILKSSGTGCTKVDTVPFNLLPVPSISILGPDTTCANNPVTYTATGGSTYVWGDGTTTDLLTVTPTQNTVYTVIGTAANTCTNTQNLSVLVKPSPTLLTPPPPAVCAGKDVTVVALGATSYSWSNGSQLNYAVLTPTADTTVMVTGASNNGCTDSHTYSITVNALPSLSVTTTRSVMCKGEKANLRAFGATNYTWTGGIVSTQSNVLISPTITTTFSLTGKDVNGCISAMNFTQTVDACLGLNDQAHAKQFVLFPNPSSGAFSIQMNEPEEMQVFNQLGERVRTILPSSFEKGSATVSDLAPGIYMVACRRYCVKVVITD